MPFDRKSYMKEYNKQYQKKLNTEEESKRKSEYHKQNPHIKKISEWKARGMKLKPNEDWVSIYLFYLTCDDCEQCGVRLTTEQKNFKTRRTLDHDHDTGFIREVLCHSCNVKRG